jgi:hypothetical protein
MPANTPGHRASPKLGPDAFTQESRKAERLHFWYSRSSREYMRGRSALAYLLWQKMGRLKEAIAHPLMKNYPLYSRVNAVAYCSGFYPSVENKLTNCPLRPPCG